MKKKFKDRFEQNKLKIVQWVFVLLFLVFIARLFKIQIIDGDKMEHLGDRAHITKSRIETHRGSIDDRNGTTLALSIEVGSMFARPHKIENKRKTAEILSKYTGMTPQEILKKISQPKTNFVWLKRKLDKDTVKEIKKLNLSGIDFENEFKRIYPRNQLASHIIGFAGIDNHGLEGIESYFDKYLNIKPEYFMFERDALGRKITPLNLDLPEEKGFTVTLTIDEVIQQIVEDELKSCYEKYSPKSAWAIVMNPYTGEVLAASVYPEFDLNNSRNISADTRRNRLITDFYEPGSTFKIFITAALLEKKLISENDRFVCNGSIKVGPKTIKCHVPHGKQNFRQVVEQSCNVGFIKATEKFPKAQLFEFIRNFGFGNYTGITIPGESRGIVRKPDKWSEISKASVSIGQEIAVTPLQLITGACAIANGGKLVTPILVKSILDGSNNVVKAYKTTTIRQVISDTTARKSTDLLKGVVSDAGTGNEAFIEGFKIAGKTGTAQKYDVASRQYSISKHIASFLGWVPADRPELIMLVAIDEPKSVIWGGVAAPVFRAAAGKILTYLRVPPEGKNMMPGEEKKTVSKKAKVYGADKVPDLSDMTIKEVLSLSRKYGFTVKIRGSGTCGLQNPPAGETWGPARQIDAYFQ